MKQIFGMSQNGTLSEAVKGISSPALLLLISNKEQFADHVAELESLFPGVPSIGCIAMSYDTRVVEHGVGVVAFSDGVKAVANVLEEASTMPVRYIGRLEQDLRRIEASARDTVCIDFCTGNDACVLTTACSVLGKQHISLTGGTGDAGMVSANGRVYQDAAVYALVKNRGKVKVYKENLYQPMPGYRFIASKTDRSNYIIGELNGRPAKQVYMDTLHIRESDIENQTFRNPLGKINGKDICIISLKGPVGNALSCFRQVNDSDVLSLLEMQDYRKIIDETIANIREDFPHISGVFSINCLFRYLFFTNEHQLDHYLNTMGPHAGFFGYGEHFNQQFVNQTMSCVVFE